ncbi:response regulator transcription factor [Niveispirillum cyanobacteriorum]|nr:response regulator transcription factor [Niveispirillum cyanobacteriorum]GGE66560.1 DNA-binding response regulator [Niveispirillum cyanobacteriorum]
MTIAVRRGGSPLRVVTTDSYARPSGVDGVSGVRRRCFLIIDPQALVRHGLALTLASLHDGAQTWQAGTPAEALGLLSQATNVPDVVLMDADGLGTERMTAIADFLAKVQGVPAIIMSSAFTPAETRTLLTAGAVACLLKSDPSAVLAEAVALALTREGYVQMPYGMLTTAVAVPAAEDRADFASVSRLTNRQRDIFRLLLSGCSNKEIARQLGVLEGTVKVHVRAMMQKLGARNRTQIAILAARTGFRAECA